MALIADGGGGGPTLNPKAKHYERELFKVFAASTSTIWLTQEDWRGAKTQLEDLAKDVRLVRTELEAPGDGGTGWQGPAAEAALASLEKLRTTLDGHAAKVGEVDTSLGQVYKAISDAKAGWYSDVASISTYVDPADHTRLPAPYLPTAENRAKYSVPDSEAAAAAEDALWEERNQAAKRVLDQLGADTQTATATMPIESKTRSETPYSGNGPGPSTQYPTGTATPSGGGGGYQVGAPVGPGFQVHPTDQDNDPGGEQIPIPIPEEPEVVVIVDPGPDPDPSELDPSELDPISSDGDVTGSTGVTGTTTPSSTHAAGGGGGGLGLGGVAAGGVGTGAAGIGGLLGARGGGMFGSRGGGAVPAAGTQGRATGAGGRGSNGSAVRSGGAAGRGSQVIPGGGQGRAATSTRGTAVKGASGSGRYGVPKLDGKGGVPVGSGQAAKGGARSGAAGRGSAARGAAAAGAAGGRGSGKGERGQTQDTDKLTHEDEETWYDGTEDSSPQVWE